MAQLQNISDTCGYTDYLDQFVTYPPKGQSLVNPISPGPPLSYIDIHKIVLYIIGLLPLPNGTEGTFSAVPSCRLHSPIQRAIQMFVSVESQISEHECSFPKSIRINPVFDVYRVQDTWPNLWSVLGFPRSTQEFIYFNRYVVRLASRASSLPNTSLKLPLNFFSAAPTCRQLYMPPTSCGRVAQITVFMSTPQQAGPSMTSPFPRR